MARNCAECKFMVKIISCWCYRHLHCYSCDQERNNTVPVENYDCCGSEAKYFELANYRYIGIKYP